MKKPTVLKITLLEEGLTQRALARETGLDEAIISLIATGRYNPDSGQRAKIAKALKKSESEIFEKVP